MKGKCFRVGRLISLVFASGWMFLSLPVPAAADSEKTVPRSYKLVEKILFSLGEQIITLSDQKSVAKRIKGRPCVEEPAVEYFYKEGSSGLRQTISSGFSDCSKNH